MRLWEALGKGSRRLAEADIASPVLEARLLMEETLGVCAQTLLCMEELQCLSEEERKTFESLITVRTYHKPMAYILGRKDFFRHTFCVDSHVFIPRPETELILELAQHYVSCSPQWLLDLGTGSGCLLLSLLSLFERARGVGVDYSMKALQRACDNARLLSVEGRSFFVRGFWFRGLSNNQRYDLIVSNPPYIRTADIGLSRWQTYEPPMALDGGENGLQAFYEILPPLRQFLKPDGVGIVECGENQAEEVQSLMKSYFQRVYVHKDLAGIKRHVVAIL